MKIYVVILISILLFACHNAAENQESAMDKSVSMEVEAAATDSTSGFISGNAQEAVVEDQVKADLSVNKPKLIKNGYLTIEVEDYQKSKKDIKDLVLKNGGYLGNETESNETYRLNNELLIRIPSSAFDKVMDGLMATAIKTDSKRIEVQDVGEEYADLSARIIAKKAVEKRYLDILNKASKISDILEVEEKLRVIREETEAAQGRMKYLESQVAYSTISLSLYKTLDTHYTPPSGPNFYTRIWKGLVQGWESILGFIVGLAYLWPLWVILLAVWFWIRKKKFIPDFFRKK